MRRLLALVCCAVTLTIGFAADWAHVHVWAGADEGSRGRHPGHVHLVGTTAHDGHGKGSAEGGDVRLDARHVDHHDDDAIYLQATTAQPVHSSIRVMPAIASVGTVVDPPSKAPNGANLLAARPRDPPRRTPLRLRAPPV